MRRWIFAGVVLASVAASPCLGQRVVEADGLEGTCRIDFRGETLSKALAELAYELDVPFVVDEVVDEAALGRPVRVTASHLTGEQAFRWVARAGGLSAVLVDGIFLVAAEEHLPVTWHARGRAGRESEDTLPGAGWESVADGRADIEWIDAPLSGVAEQIARKFGVDMVCHRDVIAEGRLVCFEGKAATLREVSAAIAEQLDARIAWLDGALWVCPLSSTVSSRPAAEGKDVEERPAVKAGAGSLRMPVRIGPSVKAWRSFVDMVAAVAGVRASLLVPAGVEYPGIEAEGSVLELLEAAQLLGWLTWELDDPAAGESGEVLKIELYEKG